MGRVRGREQQGQLRRLAQMRVEVAAGMEREAAPSMGRQRQKCRLLPLGENDDGLRQIFLGDHLRGDGERPAARGFGGQPLFQRA